MNWYDYDINITYGNKNVDVGLGGSHDMDVLTPLGTMLTILLPGVVVDISGPSWGLQLGIQLDELYNGVEYMAYLHIGYLDPSIHLGAHVSKGQYFGLSGGATYPHMVDGHALFVNSPNMSSQPQTGIALMRGPVYGTGAGWDAISPDLNPEQIVLDARKGNVMSGVPQGWKDDGKRLTAPNGHYAELGFRAYILGHSWNPSDQPRSEEFHADPLDESNASLGAGQKLVCEETALGYTPIKGVFIFPIGREYDFVLADRNNVRTLLSQATGTIAQLKAGLPRTDINNAVAAITALAQDLTNLSR